MENREIVTYSAKETQEKAGEFVRGLLADTENAGRARLVCLWGDLGSGKTTFTQGVAAELGVRGVVNSPTFLIMKKYFLGGRDKGMSLYHFDCYRVSSAEEIFDLGWEEILADGNNLVLVEWPEKIASILPEERIDATFETVSEDCRRIIFRKRK